MKLLRHLIPRARNAQKRIVLPEGSDPRVLDAAVRLKRDKLCHPIVLGAPGELAAAEKTAGLSLADAGVEVCDPVRDAAAEPLARDLFARRRAKGMTASEAVQIVRAQRLYFGALMLNADLADGMVAGSLAATPDVLRAAFHCVGTAPGITLASSCFVMVLDRPTESGDEILLFADCGVVPDPNAVQLVDIAQATALTYKALLARRPKLVFLSFSTKGSGGNPLVDKMREAAELTRERFALDDLDDLHARVDGELQVDAALVPSVARRKCAESPIQGDANILIFPDLQAGNIAYKLVQRLAGAKAYGPILQGLAKPINDLSRGCNADDILGVALITICQGLKPN